MIFDWDPDKADVNHRKHGVPFEEASSIFADKCVLTIHDAKHSRGEDRWVSMGISMQGRLRVVVHTWPEVDDLEREQMRIVSSRKANKRETATYMERKR